jgi:hypothetical protein
VVAYYQDPSNHSDSAMISVKVGMGGGTTPPSQSSVTTFTNATGVAVASYTDADLVYVKVVDPSHAGATSLENVVTINGQPFSLAHPAGWAAGTFITTGLGMNLTAGTSITATYKDPTDPKDTSSNTIAVSASIGAEVGPDGAGLPIASEGVSYGFGELTADVAEIVFVGVPGPLYAVDDDWVPIVAGDDDTSVPSTVVMARGYGQGRLVAMGHDGLIGHFDELDNATFLVNVVKWLDASNTRSVAYTTGHGEFVEATALAALKANLESRGYTLQPVGAPLSSLALQRRGVLIVGNAWGAFQDQEIAAVEAFASSGHGVLLLGAGWPWEPYHPGSTMEDYPMMRISEPYGIRWLRDTISDPTNEHDDSPVFHTFYPDISP